MIMLVMATLLGARLHALVIELGLPPSTLWHAPALLLGAGFRLPGGILLALVLAPLLAGIVRVPIGPLGDAAAPFAGVALALGRLGCLLRGCCFGHVSDLPWAVLYPAGTAAALNHAAQGLVPDGAASLATHPLPVYLEVAGLVITGALVGLRARRRYPGEVGLALLASLGVALGGLEAFRETTLVSSVPLRQALPLIMGGTGTVLLGTLRLYGPKRSSRLRGMAFRRTMRVS